MRTPTTPEKRQTDRLQIVANTIRYMKDAPKGSTDNIEWPRLNLAELESDRQVDGFSMAIWLAGPQIVGEEPHQGGCKTIGCIAGTTVALFRHEVNDTDPSEPGIFELAGDMLGLDEETAQTLFWGPALDLSNLPSITREQAARACEKTASGCEPDDIWSHICTKPG